MMIILIVCDSDVEQFFVPLIAQRWTNYCPVERDQAKKLLIVARFLHLRQALRFDGFVEACNAIPVEITALRNPP